MKICIDQEWYDLTKWAKYHPGGIKILERFDNQDATDHFYSLHSEKAIAQFKRMRPTETKEDVPAVLPIDESFRELKTKLENAGWWERNMLWELAILIPIVAMVVAGTAFAWTSPLLSILLLGIAQQQAGWLGHDMTHARNSAYNDGLLRYVSGWINGFDRNWWSEKHNTHHVLTNHVNHDPDVHVQPILFLWAPTKAMDHALRKYQHLYFILPYSLLYASWRWESLKFALAKRDWSTLVFSLLPSYIWLGCLPTTVAVGSVLFAGILVAIVVTLSHESEDLLLEREPSYSKNQFLSTRNIECPDWITEYLFGGMQYQLEHHLFPTMPRYKYRLLVPTVRAWAKANNLEYKSDTLLTMLKDHVQTLKKSGELAAREIADKDEYLLDW
eukprot:TRINITY_DN10171_c0_g1_i4.p1 TRINITY_DN10171_c0_g1~~TRINITY_DN10171_c0_g1_i4.p1  ORF type:complete len:387 (+),score=90.91 TRINITY_DN10171_c0_g1_i4:1156-2316(+)